MHMHCSYTFWQTHSHTASRYLRMAFITIDPYISQTQPLDANRSHANRHTHTHARRVAALIHAKVDGKKKVVRPVHHQQARRCFFFSSVFAYRNSHHRPEQEHRPQQAHDDRAIMMHPVMPAAGKVTMRSDQCGSNQLYSQQQAGIISTRSTDSISSSIQSIP